jgi:YbgC/YbaW family acyl-CoA thioester hydrolase
VQEIVILDNQTLRPVAAPENLLNNLQMENPRIIPHRSLPEVAFQAEAGFETQRVVEWRDLDWQQHVNNANYPAFAQEAALQALTAIGWPPARLQSAELSMTIRRVQIQHQAPASWGERLKILTHVLNVQPGGGTWYMQMKRASDGELVARCALDWMVADRVSGKEQPLEAELLGELTKKMAGEASKPG